MQAPLFPGCGPALTAVPAGATVTAARAAFISMPRAMSATGSGKVQNWLIMISRPAIRLLYGAA